MFTAASLVWKLSLLAVSALFADAARAVESPSDKQKASLEALAPVFPTREGEDTEGWDGSLNGIAVVSEGNSDVENVHLTFDAKKRWDANRISFLAGAHNGRAEGTTTVKHVMAEGKYDRFLDERSYLYAVSGWRHDAIADLEARITAGVGYGYQWVDEEELKVGTEAGVSWVYEDLDTSTPDDWVAARLGWNVAYVPSETWSFGHVASLYPSLEDQDDLYGTADTFARVSLSESVFAQLNWAFAWDNTPATGAERGDHLYTLTVGWTF